MIPADALAAGQKTTVDAFLGGRITLVQPREGHRAGLDAAFLQALVGGDARGHAVDFGCGVGTVGFCLAARAGGLSVTGIERDGDLVGMAETALRLPQNAAFAKRVQILNLDVTQFRRSGEAAGLANASVDWVLMNPPFDEPGHSRASPDPARRAAHMAEPGSLAAWTDAAAAVLRPGGGLGIIHRAQALPDILSALSALSDRFGAIRVRALHPRSGEPARRVLVQARRASRAALLILPGLVLHEADGSWTPTADAILRGDADLGA